MDKAKKSICFFILAAAAVVSIVSIVLYGSSYSTTPKAYGFMIAGVAVAAVSLVIGMTKGSRIANWGGAAAAALMAAGLGWSLTVMVDAIGYVISGLYQFSTLQSYITYAICAGIGWLLYLVSGFSGILKK